MKSIKPGRGPSMMGTVGSICAALFGVIWTLAAASMGAPFFFPLFGLIFIGLGISSAVYNFKNATGENRYSSFDIVDEHEEPDPLNQRFGSTYDGYYEEPSTPATDDGDLSFCPYCGAKLGEDFAFCGKCGRQLPETN